MPLNVSGMPIAIPDSEAPPTVALPVPYATQNPYLNLCWAACGQMVFGYHHINVTMCTLASKVFNQDCCTDLTVCDQPAWPYQVYDVCQVTYKSVGGPMSANSVSDWIRSLYPIQIYFQWTGGGAHTALIVGFFDDGDLLIYDPKWGSARQSYDFVLKGYGVGSWQETWYDMETSGGPLA